MTQEIKSPLAMQMKRFSSRGIGGLNITEHQGHSRTLWANEAVVTEGDLVVAGIKVQQEPGVVAVHKDETKSGILKDGVSVELVKREAVKNMDPELVRDLMNNDEY